MIASAMTLLLLLGVPLAAGLLLTLLPEGRPGLVRSLAAAAALIQLAELPVWALCATVLLGAVFTFQLFALKESSENYDRVAAGIVHWSITYLSLLSVLLVVAQLLSA